MGVRLSFDDPRISFSPQDAHFVSHSRLGLNQRSQALGVEKNGSGGDRKAWSPAENRTYIFQQEGLIVA